MGIEQCIVSCHIGLCTAYFLHHGGICTGIIDDTVKLPCGGRVAEWSKALVLGTSPKGRGFESHLCHEFFAHHKFLKTATILLKHCQCAVVWGSSSVVERPLRMRKASGSIPDLSKILKKYFVKICLKLKIGLVRELNPGPRAPEARIIPLDQRANHISIWVYQFKIFLTCMKKVCECIYL